MIADELALSPSPAVASVGFGGNQNSLGAPHPLSHASDVLNRNGSCQKDRDAHRKKEDAGYDARPAIYRECVRASQTDNANKER
jgi:hypothetical protein